MVLVTPRWRAFMAALLLLALPLQGLAAACMLGCGQGSAASAQTASAHGHHGHAMDTTDHADSAAQLSEAGAGHHGHQYAEPNAADNDIRSAAGEGDSSCSACAACFVGAAMPTGESVFSAQAPTQAVHPAHAPAPADTCPRGLERPPRSVSA